MCFIFIFYYITWQKKSNKISYKLYINHHTLCIYHFICTCYSSTKLRFINATTEHSLSYWFNLLKPGSDIFVFIVILRTRCLQTETLWTRERRRWRSYKQLPFQRNRWHTVSDGRYHFSWIIILHTFQPNIARHHQEGWGARPMSWETLWPSHCPHKSCLIM